MVFPSPETPASHSVMLKGEGGNPTESRREGRHQLKLQQQTDQGPSPTSLTHEPHELLFSEPRFPHL